MKWFTCVLISIGLMFSGFALADFVPADATKSQTGVGISGGSNDGISVIHKYSEGSALQGSLSIGKGFSDTSLDYLSLHPDLFGDSVVVPYIGVGGAFAHTELQGMDSETTSVRMPLGLMINVPKTPMQFAVEVAPTMDIEPSESYLDSSIAIRVMF